MEPNNFSIFIKCNVAKSIIFILILVIILPSCNLEKYKRKNNNTNFSGYLLPEAFFQKDSVYLGAAIKKSKINSLKKLKEKNIMNLFTSDKKDEDYNKTQFADWKLSAAHVSNNQLLSVSIGEELPANLNNKKIFIKKYITTINELINIYGKEFRYTCDTGQVYKNMIKENDNFNNFNYIFFINKDTSCLISLSSIEISEIINSYKCDSLKKYGFYIFFDYIDKKFIKSKKGNFHMYSLIKNGSWKFNYSSQNQTFIDSLAIWEKKYANN